MSVEVLRSKPYVRPARLEDCEELAYSLRLEDRLECFASGGHGALAAMRGAFQCHPAETFAVVLGSEVIALFGVVPCGDGGSPWMLASPSLVSIQRPFLIECRPYVKAMLEKYEVLTGQVWARNDVHIKWLRWLGFSVDETLSYSPLGEPFQQFTMRNTHDV